MASNIRWKQEDDDEEVVVVVVSFFGGGGGEGWHVHRGPLACFTCHRAPSLHQRGMGKRSFISSMGRRRRRVWTISY